VKARRQRKGHCRRKRTLVEKGGIGKEKEGTGREKERKRALVERRRERGHW
jgi:hypothetical protein